MASPVTYVSWARLRSMCLWKRRNSVVEMTHSVSASHLGSSNCSTPIKMSHGTSSVIDVSDYALSSAIKPWYKTGTCVSAGLNDGAQHGAISKGAQRAPV